MKECSYGIYPVVNNATKYKSQRDGTKKSPIIYSFDLKY